MQKVLFDCWTRTKHVTRLTRILSPILLITASCGVSMTNVRIFTSLRLDRLACRLFLKRSSSLYAEAETVEARRRGASKRSTMILNAGPRATTHLAIRHDLSLQSRESPLPYDPPAMTARIWTCITRSVHNSWNLRCRCINVVIVDRRWQVYLSVFLRCFSEKQASKINQLK